MRSVFENKVILVTGGCGSIGSEIVKQLLEYNPKIIRVLDNNESGHYYLNQKIESDKIRNLIGDVRDLNRMIIAMKGVDIVFHAAALKHVPFCEYNPFEAVQTNVIGAQNIVRAAIENKVERVISISTDKAVNPINTMGATKLLSERILVGVPDDTKTIFSAVRFGNVLDSVGSVIPIFKHQIKNKNHLTITHKDMTRFFMTLEDAVSLVLEACFKAKGGEIFILKMESLKIIDLAEVMIEELAPKFGKKSEDFKFKYIGIRPGEKMHEALFTEEESMYMKENHKMFILYNSIINTVMNYDNKFELNSKNNNHLTKEKIEKILYEKNILSKK